MTILIYINNILNFFFSFKYVIASVYRKKAITNKCGIKIKKKKVHDIRSRNLYKTKIAGDSHVHFNHITHFLV